MRHGLGSKLVTRIAQSHLTVATNNGAQRGTSIIIQPKKVQKRYSTALIVSIQTPYRVVCAHVHAVEHNEQTVCHNLKHYQNPNLCYVMHIINASKGAGCMLIKRNNPTLMVSNFPFAKL